MSAEMIQSADEPAELHFEKFEAAITSYRPAVVGQAVQHFSELAMLNRPVLPEQVGDLTGDAAECFQRICESQRELMEGGAQ